MDLNQDLTPTTNDTFFPVIIKNLQAMMVVTAATAAGKVERRILTACAKHIHAPAVSVIFRLYPRPESSWGGRYG